MNKNYEDILSSLKPGVETRMSTNDKVIILDGLNTFIRSFVAIHSLNSAGNHTGGLVGFLKSLAYTIKLVRPSRVIIVFDGEDGSRNKRYLYPEYKANRHLKRISRWDSYSNQEEETASITNQIVRLIAYLKCLPIDLISQDCIEADDTASYLTKQLPGEVTIVSSDRDFLQLVNEKVTIYSPIKKKFYTPAMVTEEYSVTPTNFLLQKVLLGDEGDNVPGVHGMGPKKLIKMFPELGGQTQVTLDEVIAKCKAESGLLHQKVVGFEQQLRINEKLMDLHKPNIPPDSLLEIHELLENPNKEFDPKTFQALYKEDGLRDSIPNLTTWLYTNFHELTKITK